MRNVDIIIPVYRGLEETQECIKSALATLPSWAQLIVINDASPEPELTLWLRQESQAGNFIILENESNLGFVATVNRGMKLNKQHDVLLLNSDVEVANDWLERMRLAAYSHEKIGSLTPFSNNATICSFPNFCEDNQLFAGLNVAQLDDVFAGLAIQDPLVEVPTGVGFCMYIRRDCLDEVGYFDEETFGRGYGEENDWCQRAAKAGWPNYHQLNVFAYHKGGVSFQSEQDPRKSRALELLNQLHPNYASDVHQFILKDPAKSARLLAEAAIIGSLPMPKVAIISHRLGGGVAQHINELISYLNGKAWFIGIYPDENDQTVSVSLSGDNRDGKRRLLFNVEREYDSLVFLLRQLGVSHIHIHHTMGIAPRLMQLSESLGCQYDITVHDYFLINGNPTLTNNEFHFVGEDPVLLDSACAEHYPLPKGVTADIWRQQSAIYLQNAKRIIFPSNDTLWRFSTFFPAIKNKAIVAFHPDYEIVGDYPSPVNIYNGKRPLRVLVLGALSPEKGALLLEQVASRIASSTVEFHLLGYAFRPLVSAVITHGVYTSANLDQKLSEIQPDIVWYPAQWPETYSYTLSIALERALPVVVPNLGAFVERIAGRQETFIMNWNADLTTWCEFWRLFAARQSVSHLCITNGLSDGGATHVNNFYAHDYLNGIATSNIAQDRSALFNILDAASIAVSIKPSSRKEAILALLWKIRSHPSVGWLFRYIPYGLQRRIKRILSRRPMHDVLSK